ncbi:MAG TPA: cache domain-containing protein [Candidatus Obscuribacterales bacterium]
MKPSPVPPSPRQTLGLKATLVSAVLLSITTTALMIYLPWSWISKRNINAIVDQTNKEIAVGTSKEVERLFSSAQSAQQLLDSSLSRNLLDLTNPEEREFFLLSVLASAPDFTWVQYGDANGDFLGAQRTAGELHFHLRDWDAQTQTTTTTVNTYRVEGERFIPLEQKTFAMNPPYYAPDRPWYSSAVESANGQSWTVYVYRSTGTPGFDAAKAITRDGETEGVIAVGIELKKLSEYLAQLQGDRPGETFIINSQREIIASTDQAEVTPDATAPGAELQLTQFDQVQNPLLRYASTALENQPFTIDHLASWQRFLYTDPATKETYHIFLTPLGQLDWTVGTVIPESTYTAEIDRNKRLLLTGVLLFTGGIAGVAVILADRLVARPILGIARAAADIEANCFQPDQLGQASRRTDEIGQLARIFEKMAAEVYQREQLLRSQVQELRVEIDQSKRKQQVKEIVDTDFFKDLALKAKALRSRDR